MRASIFVAGIVYDFRVTTLVVEEVGKLDVGDLGEMSLYSDEKEKLGPLLSSN